MAVGLAHISREDKQPSRPGLGWQPREGPPPPVQTCALLVLLKLRSHDLLACPQLSSGGLSLQQDIGGGQPHCLCRASCRGAEGTPHPGQWGLVLWLSPPLQASKHCPIAPGERVLCRHPPHPPVALTSPHIPCPPGGWRTLFWGEI